MTTHETTPRLAPATLALLLIVGADALVGVTLDSESSGTFQWWLYLGCHVTTCVVVYSRKHPASVDSKVLVLAAVACSYVYPYFAFVLATPPSDYPETLVDTLNVLALLLALQSTVWLGTSYGLRPARRSLVTSGPYAVVRHPLFASYFLADAACLLAWTSLPVVTVILGGWLGLALRIHYEERMMSQEPGWAEYSRKVKWRVVPGVV